MHIYWHDTDPNKEVYVSGSFDLWEKKHKLSFIEGSYKLDIKLRGNSNKPTTILYKFVVDGQWQVSANDPISVDENGNVNNVMEVNPITKVKFTCDVEEDEEEENESMVQICAMDSNSSIGSEFTCISVEANIADLSASISTSTSTLFSRFRHMFN